MSYLLSENTKEDLEKKIYSSTNTLRPGVFSELLAVLDEIYKIKEELGQEWLKTTYKDIFKKRSDIKNNFIALLIPKYSESKLKRTPEFIGFLEAAIGNVFTSYIHAVEEAEYREAHDGKNWMEVCF